MKRPWQIWLLYAIGLAIVVPAFAWLTIQALELDKAESLARRQIEQEGKISVALWRMDFLLAPLLADEAARPEFVYRAVYPAEPSDSSGAATKGKLPQTELELSPLLIEPPPYVLLHFEVRADGSVISPQCPEGKELAWATSNGIQAGAITAAEHRLQELRPALGYADLLAQLPAGSISPGAPPGGIATGSLENAPPAPLISNTFEGYEQYAQQMELAQTVQAPLEGAQAAGNSAAPAPGQAETAGENQPASRQQAATPLAYGQQTLAFQPGAGSNPEGPGPRSQSDNNDLPNRGAQLQSYAQQRYNVERGNPRYKTATNAQPQTPRPRVVEGPTRQLWHNGRLILARRVQIGSETVVQGCWLDWEALKTRLKAEVADLLPDVELSPWVLTDPSLLDGRVHLLAGLPVQLSTPPIAQPPVAWTPIRISLAVSWICLATTALAGAVMLNSVLLLSERRGAFVAAVTHELRTPLTTFRMYAEMLAENMVPDAAQRQTYLETLKTEADRLAHLVENVLQYARLERGRPGQRREQVQVKSLLERCQSRLAERAAQASMSLHVEMDDAVGELTLATDSGGVEQILFNLVDNACKYAAMAEDKRIHLAIRACGRGIRFEIRDHGPGISAVGRRKLFRPFSKSVHEAASTAPGVGLGLALSKRLATDLGGKLELETPPQGGASFVLTLPCGPAGG